MADRLTDQQRERLEQSRRQAAQRRAGDGHADEIRNLLSACEQRVRCLLR
jgi:hypothetical protein